MEAWCLWPALAPAPALATGTIVVVALNLDCVVDHDDMKILNAHEQERAARFRDIHQAQRYVRAHLGLRNLLGRCLGCAPAGVRFVHGPHGRPEVADHRWLRFSLTHAGDRALVALARDLQVGIDIESVSSRPEDLAVSARWLGPAQAAALASVPAAEQAAAFCAAWTRAEAQWKSRGCGMSGMGEFSPGEDLAVEAIDVGPGWVAAVAAPGTWVIERRRP